MINIDKLSAFRYRNIINYLQTINRATLSLNKYAYNYEIINRFISLIDTIVKLLGKLTKSWSLDKNFFNTKIQEAYKLIFNEVGMCDNYVKLSLLSYGINDNLLMNQSIEQIYHYSYQSYFNYREALLDQAELLINLEFSISQEYINKITEINNNLHNIVQNIHPEYKIYDSKPLNILTYTEANLDIHGHEVDVLDMPITTELQTYTPYDVNIEDITAISFDTVNDYKYSLQKCKDNIICERILNNDIKYIKDLYHTFYTAGMQVVYDLLLRDNPNEFDLGTFLIIKLSSLLFLDVKMRDCQSKHLDNLSKIDFIQFEGHFNWRQTLLNNGILLYNISKENNQTKKFYIGPIFNRILSNVYDKHRINNIYNAIIKMSPYELLTSLTRFIPN